MGNWKMNPDTIKEAEKIAREVEKIASKLKKVKAIICPPSIYISNLVRRLGGSNLEIGSQDISAEISVGPHTGEVSANMLKKLGVKYVIIGH